MKKLLAVLSVVLVLTLLTGCVQPSTPDDSSGQGTSGGGTTERSAADSDSTTAGSTEKQPTTIPVDKLITELYAKALALTLADVSEDQITDYDIDLDYDEDFKRWVYEIDFNVGKEAHHIEINALDANVILIKKDDNVIFAVTTESSDSTTTTAMPELISADKAKEIALEKADVTEKEVSRYFVDLEYNSNRRQWEYEIDFYVGGTEYDVDIHAVDGKILKFEKETEDDKHQATATTMPTFLPEDEVYEYAALCAGVSKDKITDYKLELRYNESERYWEYEITFRVGRFDYDLLLNAVSGETISIEKVIND